jgi:hypothetical protein
VHASACHASSSGVSRVSGDGSSDVDAVVASVTAASIRGGQVIDLAGVPTRIWAADDARAEAMAAMLRAAAPARGAPSAELRFERDDPEPPPPGDLPFAVRREGPGYVSVHSTLGLVARVTPDRIVVRGKASDLAAAFRPVAALAIAHLLAARGRVLLHAATLAIADGCVLVLGPTGTGKSTVALCALRCGWPVLGDDLVALEPDGDGYLATAVPRPIVVSRDVVGDADAIPVPGDVRDRLELPVDAVTVGTRSVVGVIVTAHADSPSSTLRALRPFSVPPVVLASCLLGDTAESRRTLFPLATTLSRLPAVELAHGTRSATRVDEGAVLLEQIRARLAVA